ncbi:NrdH-redoxin [archaeon CG10_big_fil_rev_8_21_14_0_10_43_11]|nr:MAG: NrdH-redoxin [archaeon CG10_big_fil_rev_8_21_14_0_10_43_11]
MSTSSGALKKPQKTKTNPRVTVYTTPSCKYCKAVKQFLHEEGIAFSEVDVQANPKRFEDVFLLTGQIGVPQTKIEDDVVVGFDKKRLIDVLKAHDIL